jgi:hypothetical protein
MMIAILMKAFSALKAGEQLANVEGWKNLQLTTNIIATLFGFIVAIVRMKFPDVLIPDDQLLSLATGIATILGAINGYLTMATTKKIGIPQ